MTTAAVAEIFACVKKGKKGKGKWCVAKYGDPYSEFVLCIQPIQVHTHSSEHTPGAVGSHIAVPGEQLGDRCLAQGSHLSRGIEDHEWRTLAIETGICGT